MAKREVKYIPVGQHDLKTLLLTITAQKKGISEIALTSNPSKVARWIIIAEWLKTSNPKLAKDVDRIMRYIKMISAGKALETKSTADKELEALMSSSLEDISNILERRAKSVTNTID